MIDTKFFEATVPLAASENSVEQRMSNPGRSDLTFRFCVQICLLADYAILQMIDPEISKIAVPLTASEMFPQRGIRNLALYSFSDSVFDLSTG